MSALAFLLVALLLSGIGSAVLVLRNRRPTSVESGIDEFRREMSALAPPERPVRRRRGSQGPPAEASEPDLDEPVEPMPVERTSEGEAATSDDAVAPSPADPQPSRPKATPTSSPADPRPRASESAKLRSPDEPGAT
jgi:hypothetical protein